MAWGDSGSDNAVDRWIQQLNNNDPRLTSLHILSFRVVTPTQFVALFRALAQNTTLEHLYCSGHALDRACVEQLADALTLNETLLSLTLGNSDFGAGHGALVQLLCEGLAVNEGLKTLDLENKGLSLASVGYVAACLAKNTCLESLVLSRNQLDDACMEVLAPVLPQSSLRTLNLSLNAVGPRGACVLAQHLGVLSVLDVSDNPLLEGATVLGEALASNTTLQTLKMMHVSSVEDRDDKEEEEDKDKEDKDKEEESSPTEDPRSVHGNALFSAVMKSLATNRHLTHLWLDGNGIQSRAVIEAGDFSGSHLVELRLRSNQLEDAAMTAFVPKMPPSLVHLELGDNAVSPCGLAVLLSSHLEYIGLFSNVIGGFGSGATLPLFEHSQVRTLDIGCNQVTREDIEAMVQVVETGVPYLTLLEAGGNAQDEDREAWEQAVVRLQEIRPHLEVAWKRLMSGEMKEI
ncbi:hypothetical protein BDF14DRAFT_1793634 [Spinellus fusiger]|nr:hypothetical protein BDF14DRAFT_1793634 [Spinellus fusiger]